MKYKKQKNKIRKNKKGFTLIEILMIVAVIGILMGTILVSTAPIRERSEVNSLMRTMGTIVRAAGACDNVNYAGLEGDPLCDPAGAMTHPNLDPKLKNKLYSYHWSSGAHNLIGMKDTTAIIICYVGSGTCEKI